MRRLFPGHASYYGELVDCLFGQIGLSPGEFNPLGIVVFDSVSVISNLWGSQCQSFMSSKKNSTLISPTTSLAHRRSDLRWVVNFRDIP